VTTDGAQHNRYGAGGGRAGEHAIVIGGSMAGLLAARVLADRFDRVTVIERDRAAAEPAPRKGVPQGRHTHVLLESGARVLDRQFPGLFDELARRGVPAFDSSRDVRWFHHGVWKQQFDSGLVMRSASRPLLEACVRARVAARPEVGFIEGTEACALTIDREVRRVEGVRLGRDDRALAADLVVDASGRGSRTPQWLRDHGFPVPDETRVEINLGYASRIFRVQADAARTWRMLAVYAQAPRSTRYAVVFPIEDDRWIVTLAGCLEDYPPGDDAGFLEFARGLDRPDVYEAIRGAMPLAPIATFRFPAQQRRRYERLTRFPERLVVMGDAFCSFNPLYGQGMSVAALEAETLGTLVDSKRTLDGLGRRFFKRAARIVADPWLLATGADFLYPSVVGPRPPGNALLGWFNTRVLRRCGTDAEVARRFLDVMHLVRGPLALATPRLLLPDASRAAQER
jgi:2-polyprenyl-6-methoxyphenol hydroxylase-like FAD-dependent oxidoreductase